MRLIILTLLFMFTSCSSGLYLRHSEIVKQMSVSSTENLMSDEKSTDSLDDSAFSRRSNLLTLESLFGKDLESIKNKKNKEHILFRSLGFEEKKRSGADHRFRDTPIKSQWNGTCSTFSGVAGIENLLNDPKNLDLSERDSWSKYQQYSARAFVDALSKEGNEVCDELSWGQSEVYPKDTCSKKRRWRLGSSTYLADSIDMALDALDRGSVVYLGLSTPNDMLNCRSVIRTNSSFSRGGHAVLIVGYKMDASIDGGGYFIIKNSWGSDCGDLGYQYLPFKICQRSDGYCIMWEFINAVVLDNSGNSGSLEPSFKWVKRCHRLWYTMWLGNHCFWSRESVTTTP